MFTDPFNFIKNQGKNVKKMFSLHPSSTSNNFSSPVNNSISTSSSWKTILAYLFGIFLIIMIILIIVHFTLKPIFQLVPGGSGIIPTPGFNDAQVFWKTLTTVTTVNESKEHVNINNIPFNYTLSVDIFINNPYQFSRTERLILARKSAPTATIYSLMYALLPDTNDLIVSVRNTSNLLDSIIVSNVPVNSPFRITTVLLQNSMEIYVNGNLYKTRLLNAPPIADIGYIVPGSTTPVAQMANLILWNRQLSPSEIKNASPGLAPASHFTNNSTAIPSFGPSPSCQQSDTGWKTVDTSPTFSTQITPTILNNAEKIELSSNLPVV